jgi:dihydrofolate synthase/folylpolyglutamate synthase
VQAALGAQCAQAADGDEVLVFGSFYCVAEALDWLGRQANGGVQDGFAG